MENLKVLEDHIKALEAKILILEKEKARAWDAIDLLKGLDASSSPRDSVATRPQLKLKADKPVPLRIPVLKLFEDSPADSFTVQQVWERISEYQTVGKPTVNTTLSGLYKSGKLAKRGLGSYVLASIDTNLFS
jgi:hypothetical protein